MEINLFRLLDGRRARSRSEFDANDEYSKQGVDAAAESVTAEFKRRQGTRKSWTTWTHTDRVGGCESRG